MRRLTFQGLNDHGRSRPSRGQGGSKGTGAPSGVQASRSPSANLQSPAVFFLSACSPSNLCPFVCLGHYQSQSWSSFLAATQHILFLIICGQVNRCQGRKSTSCSQFSHISKSSNSGKGSGPAWAAGQLGGEGPARPRDGGPRSPPPSQAPLWVGSLRVLPPRSTRPWVGISESGVSLSASVYTPITTGGLQTGALGWESGDSWGTGRGAVCCHGSSVCKPWTRTWGVWGAPQSVRESW